MKNETAMNLTTLAATGTALDLVVAEIQGKAKVTHLPVKKAPRSSVANRNRRAVAGTVDFAGVAVGKGRSGNLNRVGGIGATKVADAEAAKARFDRVHAADRRAEARARAAEREAAAFAALDALLDG